MTKLGKVLVVFVTVMSLAFAAFIGVTAVGGPNWPAMADELSDYTFKKTGGEVPVWEVTYRVTGEGLGSSKSLPEAILDAQRHQKRIHAEKLQRLDASIEGLQQTIEFETNAAEIDKAGIEARFNALREQLDQVETEIANLTVEGTEQAQLAERIRNEVEARRTDVARLASELAQVRVDHFQVQEQITQLEQRLIRLNGQIDRADRRKSQLESEAGTENAYNPAPNT